MKHALTLVATLLIAVFASCAAFFGDLCIVKTEEGASGNSIRHATGGQQPASKNEMSITALEAEQQIRELERKYEAAVLGGDLAAFEQLLAPEFVHTSHNGKQRERSEWLANHTQGESPYTALNTSELKVGIYGPTAIVSGKISPTGRSSSGAPIEGEYRFMRIWTNNDGKWQIRVFQATRITQQ